MVDTRDVAAVAGAVLTETATRGPLRHHGAGGALLHDVAAKLSSALRREISYVDVPDHAVREALLGMGLDPRFVGALVGLYQDYRRSGTSGYALR